MNDSEKLVFETIHCLCVTINSLDPDKSKAQKQIHDFIDEFEKQYAEMHKE